LYRQYLSILRSFSPDIFLMENVKGILSSRISGTTIFERILDDLQKPGGNRPPMYDIYPLVAPSQRELLVSAKLHPRDFVVRSERFGIPQARHRVILLGIRRSAGVSYTSADTLQPSADGDISLGGALRGLPPLRSGLSESPDSAAGWHKVVEHERRRLVETLRRTDPKLGHYVATLNFSSRLQRTADGRSGRSRIVNHVARSHMADDLCRYLYCASFAEMYGRSPVSREFPAELSPAHRSWISGHFPDRFRVQLRSNPASTITSHLAKDGHHFIHWDPTQCRSLTVREAARAQTFPDDYIFLGNRTQQFSQVGNAVPPLLARQIAAVIDQIL
jgi:DNA (cytosine-5)-methyltransferase 1